jgi:hypothetical protein
LPVIVVGGAVEVERQGSIDIDHLADDFGKIKEIILCMGAM